MFACQLSFAFVSLDVGQVMWSPLPHLPCLAVTPRAWSPQPSWQPPGTPWPHTLEHEPPVSSVALFGNKGLVGASLDCVSETSDYRVIMKASSATCKWSSSGLVLWFMDVIHPLWLEHQFLFYVTLNLWNFNMMMALAKDSLFESSNIFNSRHNPDQASTFFLRKLRANKRSVRWISNRSLAIMIRHKQRDTAHIILPHHSLLPNRSPALYAHNPGPPRPAAGVSVSLVLWPLWEAPNGKHCSWHLIFNISSSSLFRQAYKRWVIFHVLWYNFRGISAEKGNQGQFRLSLRN